MNQGVMATLQERRLSNLEPPGQNFDYRIGEMKNQKKKESRGGGGKEKKAIRDEEYCKTIVNTFERKKQNRTKHTKSIKVIV
jgi:hypothetical protein